MSDQKLKDFLKNGAPSVPNASPYEFQSIVRRIRAEGEQSRVKAWQIWSLVGASFAMAGLLLVGTGREEPRIEEDLFLDLKTAEWAQVDQSDAYSDWLQLAEYIDESDEI